MIRNYFDFPKVLMVVLLATFTSTISQNDQKFYEFETDLYTPKDKMTEILEEFKKCLHGVEIDKSSIQYSISVLKRNDSIKLQIAAGTKVIPDVAVEWKSLNISGASLFENQLIILTVNKDDLEYLDLLFRKEDTKIKRRVSLDQYGNPTCGLIYSIDKQKLVLLSRTDNF
tara:strand:- start:93 stop:605 length:513 start_codon:yes stop_codon:yes gene_type:complete